MKAYHYTGQDGLLGILKSESIWATHILFQNDGSEFLYGKSLFYQYIRDTFPQRFTCSKDIIGEIDSWIAFYDNPIFTVSFCKERNLLNQFRSYSQSSIGYAIGFDVEEIRSRLLTANYQCRLEEVIYSDIEQNAFVKSIVEKSLIDKRVETTIDDDYLSYIAAKIVFHSPKIKHFAFREEREWRLLFDYITPISNNRKFRNGKAFVIPFLEIPIDIRREIFEIVIGPTPQKELALVGIKELVKHHNIKHCEAILDDSPYRNW